MNYLLLINKKLLLASFFIISLLTIILIIIKQNQLGDKILNLKNSKFSYDIENPKFTINSKKEKISINAKGARFLSTNEILLEKNVVFKSDNFTLVSPKVYFNKKNQTAYSKLNSTFISKGTTIKSSGFEIIDEGNIIEFKGKTKAILMK